MAVSGGSSKAGKLIVKHLVLPLTLRSVLEIQVLPSKQRLLSRDPSNDQLPGTALKISSG